MNSGVLAVTMPLALNAQVSVSDQGGKVDELSREEARIRDKLREKFAEAKQAFPAFDQDHDGRLSEAEFLQGILSLFEAGSGQVVKEALLHQLFKRADMDGDGYTLQQILDTLPPQSCFTPSAPPPISA